jgi:tRNA pseudouridine55 synthase
MFGLLNVDKPAGITSRDVVNRVQRLVKPHKVGHAGTLDPLATGVLIVCIGQATRLIEYVQQMPKRYVGTFLLGRESDTEDVEGKVVVLSGAAEPTESEILALLPKFLGEIQQMPPAYSALKVDGKRAYALARRGETVTLQPRPVRIDSIDLVHYCYPELTLDIRCGSGTYIRSLGRDIARAAGTEAVMSALVRREIGRFSVNDAIAYDDLSREITNARLRPPIEALGDMPQVIVTTAEVAELANGRTIDNRNSLAAGNEIAAVDADGRLIALLRIETDNRFQPVRFFPKAE